MNKIPTLLWSLILFAIIFFGMTLFACMFVSFVSWEWVDTDISTWPNPARFMLAFWFLTSILASTLIPVVMKGPWDNDG